MGKMHCRNDWNMAKGLTRLVPLTILVENAFSQSIISQIGWKGATTGVAIGLIFIIGLIIAVLIVTSIRAKKKMVADAAASSTQLFSENIAKCGLRNSEVRFLKELLRFEQISHPHTIFQSINLFEKCVHAYIEDVMKKRMSDDELEIENNILFGIRKKLGYGYLPAEYPLISTRNISVGQQIAVFGEDHKIPVIKNAALSRNTEFFFRIQFNHEADSIPDSIPNVLKLVFTRQRDGLYGIMATIARNDTHGKIDFYHTLDLKRNQLREYVRQEISIPLNFQRIRTTRSKQPNDAYMGMTADISGGGVSFISDIPLLQSEKANVQFKLETDLFDNIEIKILRVSTLETPEGKKYKHHAQFSSIEPGQREKIVRFVFEKQRMLRQWR